MQTELNFNYISPVRKYLDKEIGEWAAYITNETLEKTYSILRYINKFADVENYYPERKDVFRIYKDVKLENIKVVILGTSPSAYGNSNGYAFGCKETIDKTLEIVYSSIIKTCPKKQLVYTDKGLEYLVKQGVFLLNTNLTTERSVNNSHKKLGWKYLINNTIDIINNNRDFIVWILWGSEVKKYKKRIDNNTHLILTNTHPSSVIYNKTDWDCNDFNECNNFLEGCQINKIKWR